MDKMVLFDYKLSQKINKRDKRNNMKLFFYLSIILYLSIFNLIFLYIFLYIYIYTYIHAVRRW